MITLLNFLLTDVSLITKYGIYFYNTTLIITIIKCDKCYQYNNLLIVILMFYVFVPENFGIYRLLAAGIFRRPSSRVFQKRL